ncbi:MAG: hypothetical protein ACLT09_04180 [Flavonifractor plautii]
MFAMKKNAMNPHRLAVLAMMTAVVFAVNFSPHHHPPAHRGDRLLPWPTLPAQLSGMLLGPFGAAWLPAWAPALYDLTNPIFAPRVLAHLSLPKGAYGLGGWAGRFCTPGTARDGSPTAAVWPPHWSAA